MEEIITKKIENMSTELTTKTQETTTQNISFFQPKNAQITATNHFLKPTEQGTLQIIQEKVNTDITRNHGFVINWQGQFVWVQGPRSSHKTHILQTKIKKTSDLLHQTPDQKLLILTPYARQSEQWRMWAQEKRINLETQTPESFAHSLISQYYLELGYKTPPEWATHKIKEAIRTIWNDVHTNMATLIEHMDEKKEIKTTNYSLNISGTEKPTNVIEYSGAIQNELFSKIISFFKTESVINIDYAHYMLKALLESRTDLRNSISRKYAYLFLEEPEEMDKDFFSWFPLIKFQNIYATSTYNIKSKKGLYPWLEQHWSNPDGREVNQNMAFFGIPLKLWKETHTRNIIRSRYAPAVDMENFSPKAHNISYNKELAEKIKTENLWPNYRKLHLTIEPDKNDLRPGIWAAKNIIEFHNLKTEYLKHLETKERYDDSSNELVRPQFHQPEIPSIQVFFALPNVTRSDSKEYDEWQAYFTSAFPALEELNLDVRYLSLTDGPMEDPRLQRKAEVFVNTVWIGTPIAVHGCEFDIVIIPSLESEKWPHAESTAWDWLDLCISKAKYGAFALGRKSKLPHIIQQKLPASLLKANTETTTQATLFFEPLFIPETCSDAFGPKI